jgi:hypothetical protein
LTGEGDREMLTPVPPAAILALGGLWFALIAFSAIALIVLAVYAFWKMRSEDFWDEQA